LPQIIAHNNNVKEPLIMRARLFAQANHQQPTPGNTATIQYFQELLKGNQNLDDYRQQAIADIKSRDQHNLSTPPDIYFLNLHLNQGGIVPPHIREQRLEELKQEALQYVRCHHMPDEPRVQRRA
jgi:hypothetical protein